MNRRTFLKLLPFIGPAIQRAAICKEVGLPKAKRQWIMGPMMTPPTNDPSQLFDTKFGSLGGPVCTIYGQLIEPMPKTDEWVPMTMKIDGRTMRVLNWAKRVHVSRAEEVFEAARRRYPAASWQAPAFLCPSSHPPPAGDDTLE